MSDEFHLPSLADESYSRYFSSVSSATKEFRNFLSEQLRLTLQVANSKMGAQSTPDGETSSGDLIVLGFSWAAGILC